MFDIEMIAEEYPDALKADGFDDCIIGMCRRYGQDPIIAYSYEGVIGVLMERDGMDYADAVEFFEFNIIGAYVGDRTPCFIECGGDL